MMARTNEVFHFWTKKLLRNYSFNDLQSSSSGNSSSNKTFSNESQ